MNQEILEKIRKYRERESSYPNDISEGDIVILPGGRRKRIARIYEDGSYQLTDSHSFFCDKVEDYFGRSLLGHVHLSSGGLDRAINNELEYVGSEDASCWTWKELPCANGGINLSVPFRVFKLKGELAHDYP